MIQIFIIFTIISGKIVNLWVVIIYSSSGKVLILKKQDWILLLMIPGGNHQTYKAQDYYL